MLLRRPLSRAQGSIGLGAFITSGYIGTLPVMFAFDTLTVQTVPVTATHAGGATVKVLSAVDRYPVPCGLGPPTYFALDGERYFDLDASRLYIARFGSWIDVT